MNSPGSYYGPPRVLADELLKICDDPSLNETYRRGRQRLALLSNMLFRYDWMFADRKTSMRHLREFSGLLTMRLKIKWFLICLILPPCLGRLAKRCKAFAATKEWGARWT